MSRKRRSHFGRHLNVSLVDLSTYQKACGIFEMEMLTGGGTSFRDIYLILLAHKERPAIPVSHENELLSKAPRKWTKIISDTSVDRGKREKENK